MVAVHVLLIMGVLPGLLSQTIQVWQPSVISAVEGSSVTLPCNYSIIGEKTLSGSFKWYRHHLKSGINVSATFSGRITNVNTDQFINGQSASVTIHNLQLSDTGMYHCEVTFQIGREVSGHGNGTFLNVTVSESNNDPYLGLIYGGAAVGVLLLAVLTASVYYVCTKQGTMSGSIQNVGPIYTSTSDFMEQDVVHSRFLAVDEQTDTYNFLYSMENQNYTYSQHMDIRWKSCSPSYEEMPTYAVVP